MVTASNSAYCCGDPIDDLAAVRCDGSRWEAVAKWLLYLIGGLLFFAVLSLDREHAREGVGGQLTSNPKLFYRCIPMLIGLPLVLLVDGRYCGLQGLRSLCRVPALAVVWFLGVAVGAAIVSGHSLIGGWKVFEYVVMFYWVSVATQFAQRYNAISPTRLIYVLATGLLFYIWAVAAMFPRHAFVHWGATFFPMLSCPFPHIVQNHVGFLALSVFIIAVTCDLFERRTSPIRWLVILAALFALIFSHTRTAYVAAATFCLLVFIGCLWGERAKIVDSKRIFYFFAALASLLLVTLAFVVDSDAVIKTVTRGQDSEQLQGFSGRTTMWHIAAKELSKRPYVGYGLSIGSRRLNKVREYGRELAETHRKWATGTINIHSTVLESLLSAGVLGAVPLLALIFLWLPWTALRQMQRPNLNSFLTLAFALTLMIRAVFVSNLAFYTVDSMLLAAIIFANQETNLQTTSS